MGGSPCCRAQVSRPEVSDEKISSFGGKILLEREPAEIEWNVGWVEGSDIVSPSSTTWSKELRGCEENGDKVEQMQVGVFCSAQSLAASLWLHKLSITDGYLVKTMDVDGS